MHGHIGIVACSAEGAALCIGPSARRAPGSFADYVKCIERDDWEGVGELMLASAHKLAKIGATFPICPDNTVHQAFPFIEKRSPLPLHIAEVVANEAVARGFRRVGITGTRWLVESSVYPEKLAARVYRASGFHPIPSFGEYCLSPETSVCLGKDISVRDST